MRMPRARLTIRALMIVVAGIAALCCGAVDYINRHRSKSVEFPQARAVYTGKEPDPKSLMFSADGSVLAAAGAQGSIQLWNTKTTWPIAETPDPGREFYQLAISPDGRWLSAADAGAGQPNARRSALRLFRLNHGLLPLADAGSIQFQLDVTDQRIYAGRALAFSPDGDSLATGGLKSVEIRERSTLRIAKSLRGDFMVPVVIVYSRDGHSLALGDINGAVALFDIRAGAQKRVRAGIDGSVGNVDPGTYGHAGATRALIFCRGDTRLISLGIDNEIKVWDTGTGQMCAKMTNGDPSGWSNRSSVFAITTGEKSIVTASRSMELRLWDLDTGQLLNTGAIPPIPPNRYLEKLAISNDGSMLAAAITAPNRDSIIILWNVADLFRRPPPKASAPETLPKSDESLP